MRSTLSRVADGRGKYEITDVWMFRKVVLGHERWSKIKKH